MNLPNRILSFVRRHAIVILLVALTLALELVIVARSPVIAPDGIHFIGMARDFQRDPSRALRQYDQHFGYPLLFSAVRNTLLGFWSADVAWETAARLVNAASGAVGVILVWLLARRIASEQVARLSALLYAVLPVLRQNAADALSDTLHVVLYLLSVLCVCYAVDRRSTWWMFAAGAASGLAFLVRPEGLAVAIVAMLCAVTLPSWWRQLGWWKSIGCAAIVAVGALLFVIPYTALSGKLTGKLTSKVGWPASLNAEVVSTDTPPPIAVATNAVPALTPIEYVAPISQAPWWCAVLKGAAIFGERLGDCLRWVMLLPLAVGAVLTLRHQDAATMRYLWLLSIVNIALLLSLYCVAGYIDRRHLMPLVVLFLPTIASGIIHLAALARRISIVRNHQNLSAALGISLLLAVLLPRTLRPLHETHQHKLTAARQLSELAAPGDTVLTNTAHVVYYAAQRGKVIGGVTLRNGVPEPGPTQLGGHRFAVIEQGGPLFHDAWERELDATYTPIATIPANAARDQNEIVIYERRSSIAAREQHTSLR